MLLDAIESVVGLPHLLFTTVGILWLLSEISNKLAAKAVQLDANGHEGPLVELLSRVRWGVGIVFGGVGLYFGLGGIVMLLGRVANTPFGSLVGWTFATVSVVIGALLLLFLASDIFSGFRRPTFTAFQESGKHKSLGV